MNREEMLGPAVSPETGQAYEPGTGYKGVGIGAGVVVLIGMKVGWSMLGGGTADVPAQIAQGVVEARRQLPMRVDEITTITDISSEGTRIIYGMRIDLDIPTDQIPQARTAQQTDVTRTACATPQPRQMIDAGATLVYRYTDRSGDRFDVEVGSCRRS
jgi:hypothetical protein